MSVTLVLIGQILSNIIYSAIIESVNYMQEAQLTTLFLLLLTLTLF